MPFSAPTTYKSKGNTGYEAIMEIGSPLAALLEIKSIKMSPIDVPEVPLTHLLSPNNTEEFSPGMIKPGKVAFSGNFIGDSTQLSITTLTQAQTIFAFSVIASVQQGAKTYTFAGTGFFTKYEVGPFENNKAVEFMGEIQIDGTYTESVA